MLAFLLVAPPPNVASLISFDAARARRDDPALDVLPVEDAAVRRAAQAALTHALAKYPAASLLRHLRRVYVMRDVRCDGTVMGATNAPGVRSIWVSVGGYGQTPRWIETSLHHEMGHLLADTLRPKLPERAWRTANAKGFRYTYGEGGGFTAVTLNQNVDETIDPLLCAKGPLSAYGATEFDEDWATYCERMVDPEADFRAALRRFPRVRAKTRLALRFYRAAFPGIRLPDVK